jgi:hypothetical protein
MIQVPPGRSLLAGRTTWPLWFAATAIILAVLALASIWMGTRHGRPAKIVWTVIVVVDTDTGRVRVVSARAGAAEGAARAVSWL